MKTLKAITDFGTIDVEIIGKQKEILNDFWVLAKVPCKYMNATEPITLKKILHVKTGMSLPLYNVSHRATNKEYFEKAETFLSRIPQTEREQAVKQYQILNQ